MILLIVSDCTFELNAQMLCGADFVPVLHWFSSLYLLKSLSLIVHEILILVNLLLQVGEKYHQCARLICPEVPGKKCQTCGLVMKSYD